MQEVVVRRAVVADQKVLVALQWRASLSNPGDRETLLAKPDVIQLPIEYIESGSVYVAELAGSIKGYAVLLCELNGRCELEALFVEPAFWRKGIGSQLVDFCCLTAQAKGSTELYVVGNPHAKGFYEASGFLMLGAKKMEFGTGLLMKRALES